MERIYAFMPTMPSRYDCVGAAIESILPQVDVLYVFGFGCDLSSLPSHRSFVFSKDVNRGSASRFALAKGLDGYLFFCDDDLAYPPYYVDGLCDKIEEKKRKAVVGWHGKTINPPLTSMFGTGPGRVDKNYPCLGTVLEDVEVDIIGTGAMAYHSQTLQIDAADFRNDNLDDAEFSILCENRAVPRIVIAHEKGDLKYLNPTGETIWDETVRNPNPLFKLINSHKWKRHG